MIFWTPVSKRDERHHGFFFFFTSTSKFKALSMRHRHQMQLFIRHQRQSKVAFSALIKNWIAWSVIVCFYFSFLSCFFLCFVLFFVLFFCSVLFSLLCYVLFFVFSFNICFSLTGNFSLCESIFKLIHTLRIHYAHAAANLNSGYSKYAKVARVHYFCTIALRTSRVVLTRAWASRKVDLRERRVDSFSKRVIICCW